VTTPDAFPLPQRLHTRAGEIRRLGIELEFAGIDLDTISTLVMNVFGGQKIRASPFEYTVTGTTWGDFSIEIDISLLKNRRYLKLLDTMGIDIDAESLQKAEDMLARIAATVVPHEIATPPFPMNEVYRLESLRESLQQHHALGTRASLRYAFGLQFNPELPSLDAETILVYLRAFFLLIDWLQQRSRIVLSRRISPFINDFPQLYIRQVLDPDYRPDLARLIDDYLTANPTRNRPLDMLPLFAHVDRKRVYARLAATGSVKINPRPTFHYRLPNCLIDDPNWTIAHEWRGWLEVEELARHQAKIHMMSTDYLEQRGQLVIGFDEDWARRVDAWLNQENP
jgi:hypothetical protein